MAFFTRPPPPRLPRTGDHFFRKGTDGNHFLKGLLKDLDSEGQSLLKAKAKTYPETDSTDHKAREALEESYQHLLAMKHHGSSRASHAEVSTGQIATTIARMVSGIRERFLKKHGEHGDLIRYEIRDGFEPLDRAVLWFRFPCPCGHHDESSLLADYRKATECSMQVVKYFILVLVAMLYVITMLLLSFSQLTLGICKDGTFPLPFKATDSKTGETLSCGQLIARCGVPEFGYMTIETYYGVRIFVYLCSLVPFMLFALSPTIMSRKLLRPLIDVGAVGKAHHTSTLEQECPLCDCTDYDVDKIFNLAAVLVFFTHCAMGAVTIAMDAALANYIGTKLPSDCHSADTIAIDPWENDCACATLLAPYDTRGLMAVSPMQKAVLSPYGIAVLMLVQNIAFTLWGFYFTLQTCTMGVIDRSHAAHEASTHDVEKDPDFGDAPAVVSSTEGSHPKSHGKKTHEQRRVAADADLPSSRRRASLGGLDHAPVVPQRLPPFDGHVRGHGHDHDHGAA